MQLIDAHVHLYTYQDLVRASGQRPYDLPPPHALTSYLDALIDANLKPQAINNVHLSILPDSENVFASFAELDRLQAIDPQRYGDVRLVGTIKADPAYATHQRLSHPQVKGIRIVLHDAPAQAVEADAFSSPAWQQMYARLRDDQHVHIYAMSAATNVAVLRQVPKGVVTIIDHLGSCYPEKGVHDTGLAELLDEAKQRGNVYFKGPGYRTGIEAQTVVSHLTRIVRHVGANRVILEATDAPHVGKDACGRAYADHFTPAKAFRFVQQLATAAADLTGTTPAALLRGQASVIFSTTP